MILESKRNFLGNFLQYSAVLAIVILLSLVCLRYFSPVYIQYSLTESLYDRWFLMRTCDDSEIRKDVLVNFNTDRPEWYPKSYWPNVPSFLKQVTGVEGDIIYDHDSFLYICPSDHIAQPDKPFNSQCNKITRIEGVPYKNSNGVIEKGYFFGSGLHPLSVDSRYFGLQKTGTVISCGSSLF